MRRGPEHGLAAAAIHRQIRPWQRPIGPQPQRRVRPAQDTAAPFRQVQRCALQLRYQVYCIEYNFLSAEDYPDGVETDEYDDNAAHFYAFDQADDLAGYVRLVLPNEQAEFPFQRHCGLSAGTQLPLGHHAAEISRLMVRGDYRRRHSDKLSGVTAQQNAAAFSGDRRHQSPLILLNLYRQMYQYSLQQGIRYWYAAMEKPLAKSLSRLGFGFLPIGPDTDACCFRLSAAAALSSTSAAFCCVAWSICVTAWPTCATPELCSAGGADLAHDVGDALDRVTTSPIVAPAWSTSAVPCSTARRWR
jgi:N-acyl amino acid synthase of PEP-CTERM/exosortase system